MDLIIQRDENGSTPLHFAAGLPEVSNRRESVCSILLEVNTDAMYQLDNDGLSPIHIAASVGRFLTTALFLEKCPGRLEVLVCVTIRGEHSFMLLVGMPLMHS
jgi:ankyrin repeat protein